MPAPAVKGYMPLCVTPRSQVCDEQGVGQWPMWKRYDSLRGIVDQNVDEPYRSFLSLPFYEIDKLKAEELFYWYTPRCNTVYTRLSRTGDDHDYYKSLLDKTLTHYQSVVKRLKEGGKAEESNFLQLSLKYAGESEDNVFCGDGRVVVALWGMRPRPGHMVGGSKLSVVLTPEPEMHTVRFVLGNSGHTNNRTELKKSHGSRISPNQVPVVTANEGFSFAGWDRNPVGAEVLDNLLFSAQYRELKKEEPGGGQSETTAASESGLSGSQTNGDREEKQDDDRIIHHVRFLTPQNVIIKEFDVVHGKQIQPGDVPQLPLVDDLVCPSWDGDPLNDAINADRDYKALMPEMPPKIVHTVRFMAPGGKIISQAQVEHGTALSAVLIPPLPVVDGKVCPSWDSNPLGTVIDSDRDFVAEPPQVKIMGEEDPIQHTVRFLNSDGSEVMRSMVPHGGHLLPSQIPELPVVEGRKSARWRPDPTKQVINRDTDFMIRDSHSWNWNGFFSGGGGRGFWKWLLYIILFLLLVFLVLYIMYRLNPCSR